MAQLPHSDNQLRILRTLSEFHTLVRKIDSWRMKPWGMPLFNPQTPMIVVGGLRLGGDGKTTFTLQLARYFLAEGLRVGIVSYRLKNHKQGDDEQLLRESGCNVYLTRNRYQTWKKLDQPRRYDLILSDDGFQDPRLEKALNIVLVRYETSLNPMPFPLGSFRENRFALSRADIVVNTGKAAIPDQWNLEGKDYQAQPNQFFLRPIKTGTECAVICAMGENENFLSFLKMKGFRIKKVFIGKNHSILAREQIQELDKSGNLPIICSKKDWVKHRKIKRLKMRLFPVEQRWQLPHELIEECFDYIKRF